LEFLAEYGLFLAKVVTFVIAIAVIIGLIASASQKGKNEPSGNIEVVKINDKFKTMQATLKAAVYDEAQLKKEHKEEKKQAKEEKKRNKKSTEDEPEKKRVYLLDFYGDIKAAATEQFRQEITAILTLATPVDEVVVRLESGGGMVHSYGLAASQLARITKRNIPLTICVDKVAASGGYMMACVANKICAAPFAIIGSIGVLAQIPNFHRLLKKNDIDFELLTAGEYKRTLTLFGENTDKGREKFVEDLEKTHDLFKHFVNENRPQVTIETVATGEVWYGQKAIDMQLVDALETSDDYISALEAESDIYHVSYTKKKTIAEKFGIGVQSSIDKTLTSIVDRLQQTRFFN